jgi:diacylglycerol kinase
MKKVWKHKNLKESFLGAFSGLGVVLKRERNAKIIFSFGVIAIFCAVLLKVSLTEFLILVIVISSVLVCEVFNSLVESILDLVKSEDDPHIKILKDIASAAVLISSVAAVISGAIIFLPKIISLFCTS